VLINQKSDSRHRWHFILRNLNTNTGVGGLSYSDEI
jgi:hypothetical protein